MRPSLLAIVFSAVLPFAAHAQVFIPDVADCQRAIDQKEQRKSTATPLRQDMTDAFLTAFDGYNTAWTMYSVWKPNHPGFGDPVGSYLNHADGLFDDGNYWCGVSDDDWNDGDTHENAGYSYYYASPPNTIDAHSNFIDARDFYDTSGTFAKKATTYYDDASYFYARAISYMNDNP